MFRQFRKFYLLTKPLAAATLINAFPVSVPRVVAESSATTKPASAVVIPDPLVCVDGTRVHSGEDWINRRRPELLELFREHVYGRSPTPAAPTTHKVLSVNEDAFGGLAIAKRIKVNFHGPQGAGSLTLHLYLPKKGPPTGCMLLVVNRRRSIIEAAETAPSPFWPVEAIVRRGYATAAFHYADVAEDKPDRAYDSGVFKLYPRNQAGDAWGALAAWAWGASRAIDALSEEPSLAGRPMAVAGHSRGGKVALWCGATDERVALAISNDSGTAGAALTRVSHGGTMRDMVTHFPYWVAPNYFHFVDNPATLPIDQHELLALMAPRLVYVASAVEDSHSDPAAEFRSCVEAGPVFQFFGLAGVGSPEFPAPNSPRHKGAIGYHLRPGIHDLTEIDWGYFLDFADRHWRGAMWPAP